MNRGADRRLAAVVVAGFGAFLNVYAPQSLLPMLSDAFHESKAATSLTVSVTTLAIALLAPLSGALAARLRRHRILGPALVGLTVATLLSATSPTLGWLLGWRFLAGACLPAILAITMAFVGEEWSGRGVGRVMSFYVAANVVGGFCGRFFTGVVAEHLGWRLAFVLVALFNLAVTFAILRTMPDQAPRPMAAPSWHEMRDLLRVPSLRTAYSIGFSILFSLVALFTYVTYHLAAAPYGLGPAALGEIFFVYLVGAVIAPTAGRFLDRIGFRRGLQGAAATVVVGACFALRAPLESIMLGLAIACSGAFVAQAAMTGFVSETAGSRRSTALGLYLSAYYLGGTVGAALPGLFWGFGGWTACVLIVVGMQAFILRQVRGLRG